MKLIYCLITHRYTARYRNIMVMATSAKQALELCAKLTGWTGPAQTARGLASPTARA